MVRVFHSYDMFKATGRTWNVSDPINTQTHATMYNVRHNYVVLPRKARGTGAEMLEEGRQGTEAPRRERDILLS